MTAVILVAPNTAEVTVGSLAEFVELVYGQGYYPKTGSIDSNKAALHGGAAPSPDPASLVRLGDLQSPTSDAAAALHGELLPKWKPTRAVLAGELYLAPDGQPIQRTANGTTRASYDATEQAAWSLPLRAALVPKWKPSTAYASGEFVLNPSGQIVSANTAFTSGTTYSASNWTVVSGGGGGGGASAWPGGGPTVKRGVYIPANWGSTWRAAKANHATQLVEAVFFGDSTSYGSCTTAGSEVFSWVSWLRSLSIAAGITDGGRGIVYNDRLDTVADQALPAADSGKAVLSAPTGFTASLPSGAVSPGAVSSNTVNDTITFTGKGTAIRLHYTRNSTTGRFSYSVDGGTAIIVDAYASPTLTAGTIYIGGLTEGTHTLTVVNLGSTAIRPPTTSFPNRTATGGGSLTSGTYYYVVTGTNASGETTASSVITGTSGAGGQITLSMDTLQSGVTGIKVYRTANGSGSSSGPFGLLGTSATTSFTDTGGTAPTMGTNPPGTSTAGLDSSVVLVGFNLDFFRAAGVVYYKNATSGISAGSYFGTSTTTLSPNAQVALGLTPGIGGPGGSYDWGTAKLAGPNNRAPALAVFALGINDLQGLTIASEGTPTTTESDTATRQVALVENYVTHFVRMAREAGADPLVIVPHFDLAQHAHTWGGQFAKGVWAAAVANGCAVIDFNEAFRPVGTMVARGLGNPGVHSEVNTYKAEAQFLWDNVLSL